MLSTEVTVGQYNLIQAERVLHFALPTQSENAWKCSLFPAFFSVR